MQIESNLTNPIVMAIIVIIALIALMFTASFYLATKPVKKWQVKTYEGRGDRPVRPFHTTGTQLIARWVEHKEISSKNVPIFIASAIVTLICVTMFAQAIYLLSGSTAWFGTPQDNLIFLAVVGAFIGAMAVTTATLIIGRFR